MRKFSTFGFCFLIFAILSVLSAWYNGGLLLFGDENAREGNIRIISTSDKTTSVKEREQILKMNDNIYSIPKSEKVQTSATASSDSERIFAAPIPTPPTKRLSPISTRTLPSISPSLKQDTEKTVDVSSLLKKNYYRKTQFAATPFPISYESSLVRAARKLNVDIPDIFKRHRKDGGGFNECPPHDMDELGIRSAMTDLAKKVGNIYNVSSLEPQPSETIESLTLGLVIVSFDAPETLKYTINSYKVGGMLDLFDDRVAFLNAAQEEEINIALDAGFRVYTPDPEEVKLLLTRHRKWLSQFDHLDASKLFPATRLVNGRYATYVAPSQIMSYLEMSTDIILFAEKDYVLQSGPKEQTIRSLLAGVAMLQSGTNVVRLRRIDDENREAITDCCNTNECGISFNNFQGESCKWESHLNWLAIFCDTNNIEVRSKGRVKQCMAEDEKIQAGGISVERMGAFCFSFDDSNWSNNVAMFGREWWITAIGHGAILTEGDNGMFELNMVQLCGLLPKIGKGASKDGKGRGRICQLQPGMFVHRELGKERHNVKGERNH
jgi:hypothetical protein